jgi:hypothetical protein
MPTKRCAWFKLSTKPDRLYSSILHICMHKELLLFNSSDLNYTLVQRTPNNTFPSSSTRHFYDKRARGLPEALESILWNTGSCTVHTDVEVTTCFIPSRLLLNLHSKFLGAI